ncbi:hypothetical protein LINPERPRIM_LOCUS33190 [Linum perenne]
MLLPTFSICLFSEFSSYLHHSSPFHYLSLPILPPLFNLPLLLLRNSYLDEEGFGEAKEGGKRNQRGEGREERGKEEEVEGRRRRVGGGKGTKKIRSTSKSYQNEKWRNVEY